jgi:deoxyadenosine/deoxycytidine kinase
VFRLSHTNLRREPRDFRFITVIGNVGAGKTTLTRALSEAMNFDASFESVANNPYLTDFYGDQAAWGFHLQIYFLGQRYKDIVEIAQAGRHHIQDRSIYEDVEIFARALYESGKMSERDFHTYHTLFYNMVEQLIKPDLAIYLTGSLETILSRIHQRGREAEKLVPDAYWAELHRRYDRFMERYDHSPVLSVDIDRFDLFRHPRHLELMVQEIQTFLKVEPGRAVWGPTLDPPHRKRAATQS